MKYSLVQPEKAPGEVSATCLHCDLGAQQLLLLLLVAEASW